MTRICSQLTNSKLPLQGQKNVEVKEEKNDEKNLYRDISTFHFWNKLIFGNKKNFRNDENFEKSTYSGNRPFWVMENFDALKLLEKTFVWSFLKKMTFSRKREFREIDFSKDRCFRGIELFKKTIFILVTQDPVQPLCNQVQITDKEILEQEDKGNNNESYAWVIHSF